jgi:hypothetical protein
VTTTQSFPAAIWAGNERHPTRWQAAVITEGDNGQRVIWRGAIHPTFQAAQREAEKHIDEDIT